MEKRVAQLAKSFGVLMAWLEQNHGPAEIESLKSSLTEALTSDPEPVADPEPEPEPSPVSHFPASADTLDIVMVSGVLFSFGTFATRNT